MSGDPMAGLTPGQRRILDHIERTYEPWELFRSYDIAEALDLFSADGTWPTAAMACWHLERAWLIRGFEDVARRRASKDYVRDALPGDVRRPQASADHEGDDSG